MATGMTVLVTGGAGFIGSQVVRALDAAGHRVRVLDCLHPAAHRVRPSIVDEYETVVGDVRDPDTVHSVLSGVDAVVHQAAMVGLGVSVADMPEYVGCNDLGTAVLLAGMAAASVDRLVLASSMVVYGEGTYTCPEHGTTRPGPRRPDDLAAGRFEPPCPECGAALAPGLVTEDAPLDPRNTYAATKLAQEYLAAAWSRTTGGTAVALRYHNVYGPGMPRDTPYAGVAAFFRSALERGESPRVFEDGAQRRDFVHVRDIAAANLAALTAAPAMSFAAYNIATGIPHTVGDMAGALAAAFGGPAPVVTAEYRLGDVRHITADPALARKELGFAAAIPFATGISEFATATLRR
jgi:dTDP-L-rhamnose 4-epimerase